MKVLRSGWSRKVICTAQGNGGHGCGSLLLVTAADLFKTCLPDNDKFGDTRWFVTVRCPECEALTDIGRPDELTTVPANILANLMPLRAWEAHQKTSEAPGMVEATYIVVPLKRLEAAERLAVAAESAIDRAREAGVARIGCVGFDDLVDTLREYRKVSFSTIPPIAVPVLPAPETPAMGDTPADRLAEVAERVAREVNAHGEVTEREYDALVAAVKAYREWPTRWYVNGQHVATSVGDGPIAWETQKTTSLATPTPDTLTIGHIELARLFEGARLALHGRYGATFERGGIKPHDFDDAVNGLFKSVVEAAKAPTADPAAYGRENDRAAIRVAPPVAPETRTPAGDQIICPHCACVGRDDFDPIGPDNGPVICPQCGHNFSPGPPSDPTLTIGRGRLANLLGEARRAFTIANVTVYDGPPIPRLTADRVRNAFDLLYVSIRDAALATPALKPESRTPAGDRLRDAVREIDRAYLHDDDSEYRELIAALNAYDALPADQPRTTVEEFCSTAEGAALFAKEAASFAASEAVAARVVVDRAALQELRDAAWGMWRIPVLTRSEITTARDRLARAVDAIDDFLSLPAPEA